MHKETITYVDFNGTERTEDHYFNLSKTEITELEVSMPYGLAEYLMGIVNAKNVPEIMASFKKIILSAYGIKSADGRRLEKGEEISKAFTESPAYDVLFQNYSYLEMLMLLLILSMQSFLRLRMMRHSQQQRIRI